MDLIITALVAPIVPTIVAFILGKKKSNAEIDGVIIRNIKDANSAYEVIVSNLKDQVTSLVKQNEETHNMYKVQIGKLNAKIDLLRKEIKDFRSQYPCANCPQNLTTLKKN